MGTRSTFPIRISNNVLQLHIVPHVALPLWESSMRKVKRWGFCWRRMKPL